MMGFIRAVASLIWGALRAAFMLAAAAGAWLLRMIWRYL